MKNWLIRVIPNSIRPLVQRLYYLPADTVDSLLDRRDELTPPKGMIYTGYGDFKKGSEEFLRYFVELCELRPTESVLDVGCGIGRIAIPLTKYLSSQGTYEGFDINPQGINWCRKKITPRYPNFRFRLIDVHNPRYNPRGRFRASDFRFPYRDSSFDFVCLVSVSTHMPLKEAEHYLREVSRVLKSGGRCLNTFFLLNAESTRLVESGVGKLRFKYRIDGCWTVDKKMPELAVGYDEELVRELYERSELKIIEPIHYGSWSGRANCRGYQDMLIAFK